LSFLPGMLCLLACVGKLVAEQAPAFKYFDVGSKWGCALCELGEMARNSAVLEFSGGVVSSGANLG